MRARGDLQAQVAGGRAYTEADRLARQKMPETKAMASPPPASVAIAPGVIAPQPPIVMNDEEMGQNYYKDVGRDKFEHVDDNPPKVVSAEPVSTFSIDVDTSSYSFMRRQLNEGVLPQKDAVRIEEMVNYFDYDYPVADTKEAPFKPTVAVEPCPWKAGDKLIHIGIKGYDLPAGEHPHSNLVFLLDTSGSMNSPDKLPLVIQSMKLLLDSLQPDDTVAIVTYAGNAGTALEPTAVRDKARILSVLENLGAGGSTAGAEGIRQAYNLAESHFDKKSVNRVILATDGDFNVGITDPNELKSYIERERKTGIFLSVLSFGEGNLNDQLMQDLAQNGNGVAAYIDNLNEARKVLVKEATSTLFPIAKDVKIQVEFNPATVAEYRLIGYETRHLNREDFNNDKIDAGDVGAGKAVTALYEITPVGGQRLVDDSRYQKPLATEALDKSKSDNAFSGEYAFLKIRYKLPDEDTSKLITTPITTSDDRTLESVSDDTGWATAVAGFGQVLRGGKYTGEFTYDDVINLAQAHKGKDEYGYRSEFIQLVRLAKSAAAIQKN
ncbi:MAG TPA: VWA domain-containing protein [Patescibacteria group bacterium]|nr:VWA domain-containing protein [Patescibacteria group bacterium]